MKIWESDVLVIGSGLAGIRAAIEARRSGAGVLVASRAATGKANNSAISKGHFAVSGEGFHPGDSPGQHLRDIIAVGRGINDPELVSAMVGGLKDELNFLRGCGVALACGEDGGLRYGKSPGHSYPRVISTTRSSGVDLMNPLVARAREMGVLAGQGITLLSLAGGGEGVCGALGYNRAGEPVSINAGAVVLATGGAGGLYLNTNNAPGSDGTGLAMAISAGLPLVDMEFVQFYPTYLHMPGRPRVMIFYEILVAVAGATLRNRDGEDIREIYGMKDPSSLTRDRLSRAIASEVRAGRGVGPNGEAVALDLTTIESPEKHRRLLPRAVPHDAAQLHVAPASHFTMGGVSVRPGGETGIPGLWAIGEVAGGIHGANRIGGNALAECLVLGRTAGSAAAEYSLRAGRRRPCPEEDLPWVETGSQAGDLSGLDQRLRRAMSSRAGILRDAAGLGEALAEIDSIKKALYGKTGLAAMKLGMMLDVARAVCLPALARRESRGAHFRLDHPDEREEFLGNFLVRKVNGEPVAEFVPRR